MTPNRETNNFPVMVKYPVLLPYNHTMNNYPVFMQTVSSDILFKAEFLGLDLEEAAANEGIPTRM